MKIATPEIRALAVNAHLAGTADKQQIAGIFNVDLTTLNRWIRDAQKEGRFTPRPRGHRKPAFTPEEQERLREMLDRQPEMTLREIRDRFQKSCSLTTVYRAVKASILRKNNA